MAATVTIQLNAQKRELLDLALGEDAEVYYQRHADNMLATFVYKLVKPEVNSTTIQQAIDLLNPP